MRKTARSSLLLLILVVVGCSTSTQFRLPPDTAIIVKNKKFFPQKDGYADVQVHPFFWTGITYKLVQGDKVVQRGQLKSSFRIVSFMWPPGAILYWPKGFGADCYDLTEKPVNSLPPLCQPVSHRQPESRMPWQGEEPPF